MNDQTVILFLHWQNTRGLSETSIRISGPVLLPLSWVVIGQEGPGMGLLSSGLGGVKTCDNPGLSLDPVTGKNGRAWGLIQGDMALPAAQGSQRGLFLKQPWNSRQRGLWAQGVLCSWIGRARKFKVKNFFEVLEPIKKISYPALIYKLIQADC